VCDIPLTFSVVKLPATDAAPDAGTQTRQTASASVSAQAGGQPVVQSGVGRDLTTVNPPGTNPPPGPPPPSPGVPPPPPPPAAPDDLDPRAPGEKLRRPLARRAPYPGR